MRQRTDVGHSHLPRRIFTAIHNLLTGLDLRFAESEGIGCQRNCNQERENGEIREEKLRSKTPRNHIQTTRLEGKKKVEFCTATKRLR
jgi:hypothetical protein